MTENNTDWKKACKKIIDTYKSIWIPQIEEYIDTHIKQGQKPTTPPDLITAVTIISLYESSEKIESYSKRLYWLTVVLAILTAGLTIRTFFP